MLALAELDERMERTVLLYVRLMDDIVVPTPTRWKPGRVVKAVNEVLGSLRREKHPDKTSIGRIERGFDLLGCRFGPHGPRVAKLTIEEFVERAIRLYEQDREEPLSPCRSGTSVRRWSAWARPFDTGQTDTLLESLERMAIRSIRPNSDNRAAVDLALSGT